MRPGSVCRHLKIAGRVIIARFFHATSQQPSRLQHIPIGPTRTIGQPVQWRVYEFTP
jgi:hypothetical protein